MYKFILKLLFKTSIYKQLLIVMSSQTTCIPIIINIEFNNNKILTRLLNYYQISKTSYYHRSKLNIFHKYLTVNH